MFTPLFSHIKQYLIRLFQLGGISGVMGLFSCTMASPSPNDIAQPYLFTTQHKLLNQPTKNLSDTEMDYFVIGRSFATIPWVAAPSATTARDGLGPLFNANTCASCHAGNGPGEKYNKEGQLSRAIITKLSRKSGLPVPNYGGQIAINGIFNVPFEATPTLTYTDYPITYPDGRKVILKRPIYGLTDLNYGELPDDIIIVQRRAPALIGMGLLDNVSDETILSYEDIDDANHDGISGKANRIKNSDGTIRIGRFEHKARVPSLIEQIAGAAANDMGLTNPIFPEERCEKTQTACLEAPRGRPSPDGETLDLPLSRLYGMVVFLSNTEIPIPKETPLFLKGKQLFQTIGCNACHREKLVTRDGIEFAPYTDLLLHDMGPNLADGRTESSATGSEFRTAPLWGISTHVHTLESKTPSYLHDARADTLEEAILWHGGEANAAKTRFMYLSKKERDILIEFLKTL